MKRISLMFVTVACLAALAYAGGIKSAAAPAAAWSMNATIIEACSCPMFCQCYFSDHPAGHGGHEGHGMAEHFCRFNNAFKVNKGSYGKVALDGAKFWVLGDLGGDFSKGQMDWALVTFDKAMSKDQRDAVGQILAHLYPVKWKLMSTSEGDMTWTAGKGEAHALLDGGKTAEVALKSTVNASVPGDPVVIKNLKYWGASSNDGFVLMPNTVEAYRTGGANSFEFKGTNGFMITLNIDSKSAPPAAAAM